MPRHTGCNVYKDWYLKQTHADGLVVDVPGQWGHYQLRVDWQEDLQVLWT